MIWTTEAGRLRATIDTGDLPPYKPSGVHPGVLPDGNYKVVGHHFTEPVTPPDRGTVYLAGCYFTAGIRKITGTKPGDLRLSVDGATSEGPLLAAEAQGLLRGLIVGNAVVRFKEGQPRKSAVYLYGHSGGCYFANIDVKGGYTEALTEHTLDLAFDDPDAPIVVKGLDGAPGSSTDIKLHVKGKLKALHVYDSTLRGQHGINTAGSGDPHLVTVDKVVLDGVTFDLNRHPKFPQDRFCLWPGYNVREVEVRGQGIRVASADRGWPVMAFADRPAVTGASLPWILDGNDGGKFIATPPPPDVPPHDPPDVPPPAPHAIKARATLTINGVAVPVEVEIPASEIWDTPVVTFSTLSLAHPGTPLP